MTVVMNEAISEFLERLDPKTRKQFKTAQEVTKERLATSSLTINALTGGGLPRGSITTVHGNPSSGKTGMMLESIGKLQADGKSCAFVDVENTFDREWAERLGVDTRSLILIQKRSAGSIADQVGDLIKANIDLLVIDSITAIMPEVFVEKGELKEFDNRKQMGAQSRALGMLYNGILYDIDKTAVVLISQQRADLSGQYAMLRPSGGQATIFASSLIIKLTSSNAESQQKKGDITVGDRKHQLPIAREVNVYIEKNKVGPQSRAGSYTFYYSGEQVGIDHVDEAVTLGKFFGVVEAAGAYTRYNEQQWHGQAEFVKELKSNPELYARLEKDLMEVVREEKVE